VAELDRQSGASPSNARTSKGSGAGTGYSEGWGVRSQSCHDDAGGASRFFPVFRYEAKAPASERPKLADGTQHATVKPLALMRWLVRLVTPAGGVVLDPFAGSGTTLESAILEGFHAIGIEREPDYADLCVQRLSKPLQPSLFGDAA
jgi:site-specific DNA-methyltransferase (adenine-specific)